MKKLTKLCKICGKEMPKGLNNVCSNKCAKEKERLKKVKVKEKKKVSISTLTKVLDSIFSQYIRLRDCLETT